VSAEIFNWNGFCSAEPPGLDFWRWSKSAALAADRLVEEALERTNEELRGQAAAYPDPESYGEAQYYLVEEPASFARSGLFCQLAGSFEFALLVLCNDAAIATSSLRISKVNSEIVLNRLRYLRDTTGITFPENSGDVLALTKLRNAFAHADGVVASETDRRSIESWIRRNPSLADASGRAISLKKDFVQCCTAIYDKKIADISEAILAKMRHRGSEGG
jgi:hypothetical protein